MKITLQEKVLLRCLIKNLVHNFIPMPQAMETPDAKAAMDEEWEKVKEQKGVYSGSTKRQKIN